MKSPEWYFIGLDRFFKQNKYCYRTHSVISSEWEEQCCPYAVTCLLATGEEKIRRQKHSHNEEKIRITYNENHLIS